MRYADQLDTDALKKYAVALNRRAPHGDRINAGDLRGVIFDSGGRCAWCSADIVNRDFEIDHIIPVSDGGRGLSHNLVLSCPSCNRRKAAKHPAKFAQELYAETGTITSALKRVFEHYDIANAGHQLSLFDTPAPPPSQDNQSNDALSDDGNTDDIPPYNWARE